MDSPKEEFGRIYDQYIERIYRFVYLKVGAQEATEDLCSDVFIRVWERFQQGDIRNIQPFLYQVAKNVVADHYREKGRTKIRVISIQEIEIEDPGNPVEEQAITNADMEVVREALLELSDDYQNYIIWRYLEELSPPEIAQITGKSEESVRVGVHRALQALKGKLNNSG